PRLGVKAQAPFLFTLEERRVLDDYARECIIVRWHWGEGQSAEVVDRYSLLQGLKWAWLSTSSDRTIQNCLLSHDGHPLFASPPGPSYQRPSGDLQQLTLDQWNEWRASAGPTGR
ncbi:MAG: hypothetical protein GX862_02935, partial [Leucobacter sp.]|nr:hypothetical protein [Leucobacter sp.]